MLCICLSVDLLPEFDKDPLSLCSSANCVYLCILGDDFDAGKLLEDGEFADDEGDIEDLK